MEAAAVDQPPDEEEPLLRGGLPKKGVALITQSECNQALRLVWRESTGPQSASGRSRSDRQDVPHDVPPYLDHTFGCRDM